MSCPGQLQGRRRSCCSSFFLSRCAIGTALNVASCSLLPAPTEPANCNHGYLQRTLLARWLLGGELAPWACKSPYHSSGGRASRISVGNNQRKAAQIDST